MNKVTIQTPSESKTEVQPGQIYLDKSSDNLYMVVEMNGYGLVGLDDGQEYNLSCVDSIEDVFRSDEKDFILYKGTVTIETN